MRVLFDQGTPVPLRHALAPHEVSTAFELGWSNLENGDLLREAEERFEVFVTTDQKCVRGARLSRGDYCREPELSERVIEYLTRKFKTWPPEEKAEFARDLLAVVEGFVEETGPRPLEPSTLSNTTFFSKRTQSGAK